MIASGNRRRLQELLEPVVTAAGYDLEDVSVSPAGKRRLVRVVVDRDGGVDLDAVADVSRELSAALDEADPLGPVPYVLEVTSPGVDRPLSEPRHWRRARGHLVAATLRAGGEVRARVQEADADGVLFATGERLPYDALGPGRVQVEFRREEGDS